MHALSLGRLMTIFKEWKLCSSIGIRYVPNGNIMEMGNMTLVEQEQYAMGIFTYHRVRQKIWKRTF